ncbi:MAG: hypothetical protein AC479_02855 [miscellaneous Crenarchaeota group-6 archaeon AD8-1]|nr:MAG: hypothetical protein AC479_02855 [miscellaneous Crenarchaeota group-6 archaeon AD8-1]
MDLQLYITKHYGLKYRSKGTQVKFAVVDKDKAKKYPQNFLCMLPKKLNPKLKQKYKFTDLFGSQSPQLAYNLLKDALENEDDLEVIKAIKSRLREIKSTENHSKCRICGHQFSNNKKYGPNRMCSNCRNRIYEENN